jgi:hypothetical protein
MNVFWFLLVVSYNLALLEADKMLPKIGNSLNQPSFPQADCEVVITLISNDTRHSLIMQVIRYKTQGYGYKSMRCRSRISQPTATLFSSMLLFPQPLTSFP